MRPPSARQTLRRGAERRCDIALNVAHHTHRCKPPIRLCLEVVGAHCVQARQERGRHRLLGVRVAHLLEKRGERLLALGDAHETPELHATRALEQLQAARRSHRWPFCDDRAFLQSILHELAVPRRACWRRFLMAVAALCGGRRVSIPLDQR